jgi:hypothetical protein
MKILAIAKLLREDDDDAGACSCRGAGGGGGKGSDRGMKTRTSGKRSL